MFTGENVRTIALSSGSFRMGDNLGSSMLVTIKDKRSTHTMVTHKVRNKETSSLNFRVQQFDLATIPGTTIPFQSLTASERAKALLGDMTGVNLYMTIKDMVGIDSLFSNGFLNKKLVESHKVGIVIGNLSFDGTSLSPIIIVPESRNTPRQRKLFLEIPKGTSAGIEKATIKGIKYINNEIGSIGKYAAASIFEVTTNRALQYSNPVNICTEFILPSPYPTDSIFVQSRPSNGSSWVTDSSVTQKVYYPKDTMFCFSVNHSTQFAIIVRPASGTPGKDSLIYDPNEIVQNIIARNKNNNDRVRTKDTTSLVTIPISIKKSEGSKKKKTPKWNVYETIKIPRNKNPYSKNILYYNNATDPKIASTKNRDNTQIEKKEIQTYKKDIRKEKWLDKILVSPDRNLTTCKPYTTKTKESTVSIKKEEALSNCHSTSITKPITNTNDTINIKELPITKKIQNPIASTKDPSTIKETETPLAKLDIVQPEETSLVAPPHSQHQDMLSSAPNKSTLNTASYTLILFGLIVFLTFGAHPILLMSHLPPTLRKRK